MKEDTALDLFAQAVQAVMDAKRWNQSEFARRFEVNKSWVSMVLTRKAGTTLDGLDEFRVFVGKNFGIQVTAADIFSPIVLRAKLGLVPAASSPVTPTSNTGVSGEAPHVAALRAQVSRLERTSAHTASVLLDIHTAIGVYLRHYGTVPSAASTPAAASRSGRKHGQVS